MGLPYIMELLVSSISYTTGYQLGSPVGSFVGGKYFPSEGDSMGSPV